MNAPSNLSIDKNTVHRVGYCMQIYRGAPLLELSSYPFSNYMKFVADVDLAKSLLQKSRREISKNEALRSDYKQTRTLQN